MMNLRPRVWSMVAVATLGCLAVTAVVYIDRIEPSRLASLMGITVTVSDLSVTPTLSPTPTPVGGDPAAALGSVAVQTFAGATLVRQGAGTAVSADGLILTSLAAAPWGSGGYLYQIATPRGHVVRAVWTAYDKNTGLVLLKADSASDFEAVFFDEGVKLFAGQQLEAIAAQVRLSSFSRQRVPVWVVSSADDGSAVLSMDHGVLSLFDGARLVAGQNRSVGILRSLSGVPAFIPAKTVNAFLNSYLEKSAQP